MKTVIIGGVAAGTKVGAKLKRENPNDDVVIYTKSSDISYAGCGLPYYVGGDIATKGDLIVNTPQKFTDLTGVKVNVNSEVTSIDEKAHNIIVNGESVCYDNLVIAVGAEPIVPPFEGVKLDGVFTLRTPDDAIKMREYAKQCKKAVVVGGGFIGLEVAENLMKKGIEVTVIDMAKQLMPNIFDIDMADFIARKLVKTGLDIKLDTGLNIINGTKRVESVSTTDGDIITDMVVLSVGVRPATKWLENSSIVMERGLILTDEYARTNVKNIYAVGDCAMVKNYITSNNQWSAMGSTANIVGRVAALNISNNTTQYKGCLGTGVVKLSDRLNASRTGLTKKQAVENGYDTISVTVVTDDKAHYYTNSSEFITKIIAKKDTHELLGIQVVGSGSVDKMVDIAVVGITAKLRLEDFSIMDFAYAPPFSTAIHPFVTACNVALNKISGRLNSFTPDEFLDGKTKDYTIIDVNPEPSIDGAIWVDFNELDEFSKLHKKDEKLLLVCLRGKKAYLTQNRLKALGFYNTAVLEGGITVNKM